MLVETLAPRGKRVQHRFPMRASHVAPFAPANHITRNDETKRTDIFSSGFAFVVDEFLLAFKSPAVTAESLIFTHDAMTRNH